MKIKLLMIFILFPALLNCVFALGIPDYAEPPQYPEYPWESRGIGGGGALFVPSISPHNGEMAFLSTDMSAVFQTTNFGADWRTVHFLDLSGGTDSVVCYTSDPDIMYALNIDDMTGNNIFIKKTEDHGLSWQKISNIDEQPYYLETDIHSTERLLTGDWGGFLLSTDGGDTFSYINTVPSLDLTGRAMAGTFWDGNDIFIGFDDGILYSANGGESFTHPGISGIPSDQAIVSLTAAKEGKLIRFFALTLSADDVYAGVDSDGYWSFRGIYRMNYTGSWSGTHWELVSGGFSSDQRCFFVDMAENDINTVYAAGGDADMGFPLVMKSEDGGESWQRSLKNVGNENVYTGWAGYRGDVDWWWGEFAEGFCVSQTDPDRAIITDMGFVHLTDDGGLTWRQAYVDPADQNPINTNTAKRGFYRTSGIEQTGTWWMTWMTDRIVFASMTDIISARSTDGGIRWQRDYNNGLDKNTTYKVLKHPDQDIFYAVTSSLHDMYQSTYLQDETIDDGDGELMISQDYGATWQLVHDFGRPVVDFAFSPNDPDTLYVSVIHSGTGGIYMTKNLNDGTSASWQKCTGPPRTEGHVFNIKVIDDGTDDTLVVTYSGRRDPDGEFTLSSGIFVSSNGGDSFQDVSIPEMHRWTKDVIIDPNDPAQDTWYVCVFSHWGAYPNEVGGLYRTRNRGEDWQLIGNVYRAESCAVDPLNPDHMYLTTESEGLWETWNLNDDDPVFTQIEDFPFSHPLRVFFEPSHPEIVWITSFGGGMRVNANP